ncbi:uncharacterized protein LOC122001914 [Zingiber officinale]|uniref:uncharacterized protein LOC122001914 n=1 Tax=Zingiber officinale TaxID=94328 RepID=UPI001C4B536B|nr:uncharacterized protein LOC122001914 [Zingiber officinale]
MTKSLWESLVNKYKTESAGLKKFIVDRFLDFKMLDSKSVTSQVQDMQLIMHDLDAEGIKLNESFKVAAVIEKLPSSWKDFKNYLKHKQKEMRLEDLILRLRIEEDNGKMSDSRGMKRVVDEMSNLTEPKTKKLKQSKKNAQGRNTRAYTTIAESQDTCPRIVDARRNQPRVRRMLRIITSDDMKLDLTAVVFEANTVVDNSKQWWIDTGATRHIYSDKAMFSK